MAFARKLAEWQADIWLFFVIQQSQTAIVIKCHSGLKARMPLNAIKLKKFSVFRFPFSVFC